MGKHANKCYKVELHTHTHVIERGHLENKVYT